LDGLLERLDVFAVLVRSAHRRLADLLVDPKLAGRDRETPLRVSLLGEAIGGDHAAKTQPNPCCDARDDSRTAH
jgi:hypothetical protein